MPDSRSFVRPYQRSRRCSIELRQYRQLPPDSMSVIDMTIIECEESVCRLGFRSEIIARRRRFANRGTRGVYW